MNNHSRIARSILRNALNYDWTEQGFGMLRTYIAPNVRFHVWHSSLRVPGVSDIHTHPWDFESYIVNGELSNDVFTPISPAGDVKDARLLRSAVIQCGAGAHIIGSPERGHYRGRTETYTRGMSYRHKAAEIHRTSYRDGTVSIIHRAMAGNPEHARSFWDDGEQWVSAEPGPASRDTVIEVCEMALHVVDWPL